MLGFVKRIPTFNIPSSFPAFQHSGNIIETPPTEIGRFVFVWDLIINALKKVDTFAKEQAGTIPCTPLMYENEVDYDGGEPPIML